ncbi:MAG: alkaline phosphatase, partial [bacterium]
MRERALRRAGLVVGGVLVVLALVRAPSCEREVGTPPLSPPPDVVLMVGDGFGVGAWGLARERARLKGRELALDGAEEVGFLETRAADALVTDSGAAATAWSTGQLTTRDTIGDTPANLPLLFERLRDAGRAFGLVTTSRITHATPAPFYARAPHRDLEDSVAVHLVPARPAVALGGGRRHFLPKTEGGSREDGRNLLKEAEAAGFAVLDRFVDPLPPGRPVLGLFHASDLPHELDRKDDEPELAALAVAAIRRLRTEQRPWFLLVEEGRIDSAAHDFDGPGVASDTERLDRALEAVLGEVDLRSTLVILASDHGTASPTFLETAHPESLDVVNASVEAMERRIFEGKPFRGTPAALEEKALPVLDEHARHTGLQPEDLDKMLLAANMYERRAAIGDAISRRFGISFMAYRDLLTSTEVHGHTAEPVPLRAWGVRAREVRGVRDHAELG